MRKWVQKKKGGWSVRDCGFLAIPLQKIIGNPNFKMVVGLVNVINGP